MKGRSLINAVAVSVAASIIAALIIQRVPALRRIVNGS